MPDLLLTHGYFMFEDPKEMQILKPYAPLGLLYLCSHLRKKGFDVDVFDTTFSSREQLFHHLRNTNPSILGVYANLMTRANAIEILQVAREFGWRTVVGGPEPGAYTAEYLNSGAEVVVIGEGERTLEELLPVFRSKRESDLSRVNGIAYLDDAGNVRQTASRAQIPDLDAQPWPAREAVDLPRYIQTWRDAHGKGSASVITARGCPYRCRWCSHQVFAHTHRRRKPAMVVDEVEWLLSRYSPDMIWIADDVFTIHHGWLFEYAAEMKRRGICVPFECISRADRLNEKVLDCLLELGCFRVWIGSESGSQRILDAMERGVRVEQVQSAVEMCRQRGIQSGMFLMWGYEGEEVEDIEATIEHVRRSDPDVFFTTVAYPIKGTPYFDQVSSKLAVPPKEWRHTSDRELEVMGRASRDYYGNADQLLRDEVALARMTHGRQNEPGISEELLRHRIAAARLRLRAAAPESGGRA